ncbi:urea ABC transporter permease subunit UrtB [Enemella evansiae]|uniref:urea ABC transporter permease subunit UrtB n=1 Tax=Enemella evansiae TaxID=2016499 RepID=UPI00105B23DF|nr:urea ABC transporter permease subunit UrtB [Enemella evansiae]TDO92581.1 urea ABC transporter membrane protein [Enemella evansiae]
MDIIVSQLFAGVSIGSVLLLAALGLSLTFGQMGVINMAHGEFMMAGAYTAFVVQWFLPPGISLPVALLLGFGVGGLLGLLLEVTLIRRMHQRPLDTLLVTFGVSLVLQQVARDIFGAPNVDVAAPGWLAGPLMIGPYAFPKARLFIIVLAIACVVALMLVLSRTSFGRRIRAVTQNRDLAEVSGLSAVRTDQLTFFIGSGIAGVAGVALTLLGSIGPTLGQNYIVDAFLVVVVGGLGRLKGAVAAALGLGIIQAFVELSLGASLAEVAVLLLIVAFLQFRPQGLVQVRTRSLA